MVSILSPAKTLDMSPSMEFKGSSIRFSKETNKLVKELKKYKPAKLTQLMKISDKLALLNADRYHAFSEEYTSDNSTAAGLAFKGGVYIGLAADDFSQNEMTFAQSHLRILSGLYGLLRPLDMIQAYRLEMGTKISIDDYKNLYAYWGDKITNLLQDDINESGSDVLVNLASVEYFKAINTKKLSAKILKIDFKEYRDDKLKFISFNAKKARGMMSRFIIKNGITDYKDLRGFNDEGYYFEEGLSTEDDWLFIK